MEYKYIIDDKGNFAIFSKLATHKSVAAGFNTHNKIVGAGFCNLKIGYETAPLPEQEKPIINIHCYGESISLNIESREEDENIINEKLNKPEYY